MMMILFFCDDDECDDCFSPIATVFVQGKGVVAMHDLQVGDKVLSANNCFQTVFAFTHMPPNQAICLSTDLRWRTIGNAAGAQLQTHALPGRESKPCSSSPC